MFCDPVHLWIVWKHCSEPSTAALVWSQSSFSKVADQSSQHFFPSCHSHSPHPTASHGPRIPPGAIGYQSSLVMPPSLGVGEGKVWSLLKNKLRGKGQSYSIPDCCTPGSEAVFILLKWQKLVNPAGGEKELHPEIRTTHS